MVQPDRIIPPSPNPLSLILTLSSSPLPLVLSWRCARARATSHRPGRRQPRPPPATHQRGSTLVPPLPVCPLPRCHLTLARAALQNPSRGSGLSTRMRWSPLLASPPASIRLPQRLPGDAVLRPEQIPPVPLQPPASTSTLMSMLAPVGRRHRRNPGANDSVFFSRRRGYLLPR
jgi:hypothetical protein